MKVKFHVSLVLALAIGFAAGFVFARQSSQPPTPSVDEIVKKVQEEIDASGRQVVMEVWAALQLLKEAVKEAPVPPAPMPELERKFAVVGERLSVAVETLLTQTFIGAVEKTTAVMPELNSLVFERVVQFFNASREDVRTMREKGLTWSSIIVGYGLAKASGKPAKDVFAAYAKEKAWSKVALDLGVKPQTLGKALHGLFP
ncbi:MAG: hypothetical protein N2116_05910 [Armatimonadetes bacterium]|nr:hypothetical protein [Armatimonadota bacterium]